MTVIYQLNQFFYTFLRHFLRGSSKEQKTFLGYQVTCSVPPPPRPARTTQQLELIWLEMSTRHLFFKFALFVFHLFFIFKIKKKINKIVTLDPRHGTLDIKMDSFAGKRFLLPPPPPPSFIFFFFFALVPTFSTNSRGNSCYAG